MQKNCGLQYAKDLFREISQSTIMSAKYPCCLAMTEGVEYKVVGCIQFQCFHLVLRHTFHQYCLSLIQQDGKLFSDINVDPFVLPDLFAPVLIVTI